MIPTNMQSGRAVGIPLSMARDFHLSTLQRYKEKTKTPNIYEFSSICLIRDLICCMAFGTEDVGYSFATSSKIANCAFSLWYS